MCMAPKQLLTAQDIAVRAEAWRSRRMTSHWPVRAVQMFKSNETVALPESPMPQLTPLGLSLLGPLENEPSSLAPPPPLLVGFGSGPTDTRVKRREVVYRNDKQQKKKKREKKKVSSVQN